MGNTKNKIIFSIVFIAVLSAVIALLVFLTQKGSQNAPIAGFGPALIEDEFQPEEEPKEAVAQPEKEVSRPMLLDTDYFSFVLPPGWEARSASNTLPIIIIDSREEITNIKAKEIDFRTSLSINSTELGGVSLKDYVESVKVSLIQAIPVIEIIKEEETAVDNKEAYFLEIKSIQQDLQFHTFLFFIVGKEDTVWAFSFNALEESYPDFKDIFDQAVKSIKMKPR